MWRIFRAVCVYTLYYVRQASRWRCQPVMNTKRTRGLRQMILFRILDDLKEEFLLKCICFYLCESRASATHRISYVWTHSIVKTICEKYPDDLLQVDTTLSHNAPREYSWMWMKQRSWCGQVKWSRQYGGCRRNDLHSYYTEHSLLTVM